MKTSNIIILVYLGVILTGLVVVFSISGYDTVNEENEHLRKEFPLSGFSTVIVEQGADLHLEKSDSNSISIEYLKDKKVPALMYRIQKDTLFVYGGLRTFVNAKDVNTIVGRNHSWLGIKGFENGDYRINLTDGITRFRNDWLRDGTGINADIVLQDSAQLEVHYLGFKSLQLHADNGNMTVYNCYIKDFEAELKNNSYLSIPSPDKIRYTHESGSKINIY
jgi:hypothetical protein